MNYHTILLFAYLLNAIAYFFGNDLLRLILFPIALAISWMSFLSFLKKKKIGKIEIKIFKSSIIIFFITFFIQLINGTLTPFILYIISMFPIAMLLVKGDINTKYIKIPIYIFSLICLATYAIKGTIYNVFPQMSVNYVSVVFIMNVIVILFIERRNGEKISTLPSFLGMFFSLLGLGRSGIICMAILFLYIMVIGWKQTASKVKVIYFIFLFVPCLIYVLFQTDFIIEKIENFSLLERFYERGVDSPSRDILKREYINNLRSNDFNLFFGYNYSRNYNFIHYGLNPHNSYIRLHHFFGISAIFIIFIFIKTLSKLLLKDFTLFLCLFVILLRSWTDTVIFLLLYDFVFIAMIYVSLINFSNEIKSRNIKRA